MCIEYVTISSSICYQICSIGMGKSFPSSSVNNLPFFYEFKYVLIRNKSLSVLSCTDDLIIFDDKIWYWLTISILQVNLINVQMIICMLLFLINEIFKILILNQWHTCFRIKISGLSSTLYWGKLTDLMKFVPGNTFYVRRFLNLQQIFF